jgi:hypothetical protein
MTIEAQTREPQKGLTFEKVWSALMELRDSQQEAARRQQETERIIKESQQEMERRQHLEKAFMPEPKPRRRPEPT